MEYKIETIFHDDAENIQKKKRKYQKTTCKTQFLKLASKTICLRGTMMCHKIILGVFIKYFFVIFL